MPAAPPTSAHPPAPRRRPGRAGAGRRARAHRMRQQRDPEVHADAGADADRPAQHRRDDPGPGRLLRAAARPGRAQGTRRRARRPGVVAQRRTCPDRHRHPRRRTRVRLRLDARTVRRQRVDLRAPDHLRVRQGGARRRPRAGTVARPMPGPTSAARTGSRTVGSPMAPNGSGWPGCSRTPTSPARCRPRRRRTTRRSPSAPTNGACRSPTRPTSPVSRWSSLLRWSSVLRWSSLSRPMRSARHPGASGSRPPGSRRCPRPAPTAGCRTRTRCAGP